jgi:predicted peptidase
MRGQVTWLISVTLAAAGLVGGTRGAEPRQQEQLFEKEITVKAKLKYLLYLPSGYESGDKTWPLLIFLHGAGESGDDLAKVKLHGPPKLIENQTRDFPCLVVSPQSPGRGWNAEILNGLLDELLARYRVDPKRVYLTGLSMGGFGTWSWAAAHPDRFAAIVPICGGGNPSDAPKLKDLPIWVFHGAKDFVVRLDSSERMVKAIEALGAKVKFTVYSDAGHDSWTTAYEDPELYRWLFDQKRQ